jgi:hypothetical protein
VISPENSALLLTVPQAAENSTAPETSVMTWLLASAPITRAGDWQTGEGFQI